MRPEAPHTHTKHVVHQGWQILQEEGCPSCHKGRLHLVTQKCHQRKRVLVITHTQVQASKLMGDQGIVLIHTLLATFFVEKFFMKWF